MRRRLIIEAVMFPLWFAGIIYNLDYPHMGPISKGFAATFTLFMACSCVARLVRVYFLNVPMEVAEAEMRRQDYFLGGDD